MDGFMNELHSHLCEQLLEGEMVAHLGDEKNDKAGDNSGNSRNGSYGKKYMYVFRNWRNN